MARKMATVDLVRRGDPEATLTLMYSYEHVVGLGFWHGGLRPVFRFHDGQCYTNTVRQHIHAFRVEYGCTDRAADPPQPHEQFTKSLTDMLESLYCLAAPPRLRLA